MRYSASFADPQTLSPWFAPAMPMNVVTVVYLSQASSQNRVTVTPRLWLTMESVSDSVVWSRFLTKCSS